MNQSRRKMSFDGRGGRGGSNFFEDIFPAQNILKLWRVKKKGGSNKMGGGVGWGGGALAPPYSYATVNGHL